MLIKNKKSILRIAFWAVFITFLCLAMNPFSYGASNFRGEYSLAIKNGTMDAFANNVFRFRPFRFIQQYFPYDVSGFVRICLSKVAMGMLIGVLLRLAYTKKIILFTVPLSFIILEFFQPLYMVGYFNIDSSIFYILGYIIGVAAVYIFFNCILKPKSSAQGVRKLSTGNLKT